VEQDRNIRPFTARSVVASLLLGTRPPRLPGAALVRAAAALGCGEGTTRVALSRMTAAGELLSSGGSYELTGSLAARQQRQESGRHPPVEPWDGTWILAVVGAGGRRSAGERAVIRRRLVEARLAEWREGIWARPANLPSTPDRMDGCVLVTGALPDEWPELWDLGAWSTNGRALVHDMRTIGPRVGRDPAALAPAFALAAAVVRHLRDDPLLPDELLPRRWPGATLREKYDAFESRFRAALRPYLVHDVR
jgi:phenylacetic acid degradation operon negative regulatory protein